MPWLLTHPFDEESDHAVVADCGTTPVFDDFASALALGQRERITSPTPREVPEESVARLDDPARDATGLTFEAARAESRVALRKGKRRNRE